MWKFVGGAEGDAKFNSTPFSINRIDMGEWTTVWPARVGRSADGGWTISRRDLTMAEQHGHAVAVLHDMAGGWRVMLPHNYQFPDGAASDRGVAVSHVYQRQQRLSRKVHLIYAAPTGLGLG